MAEPDPRRASTGADDTTPAADRAPADAANRGPSDPTPADPGARTPAPRSDQPTTPLPAERTTGERTADEQTAAEQTAAERTAEHRTAPEQSAEDRAAWQRAAANRAADERTAAAPTTAVPAGTAAAGTAAPAAVPTPTERQPVLEPAEESAPAAPKRQGNRLAGTAWVLLAAGLFQLLYFVLLGALVAAIAAPQVASAQLGQIIGRQLGQYATTPFAWLPVLFFFLFFELTVLLFNRAGRFAYVVASLVVGVLTYVVSVLLITILLRGSIGDAATLEQSFLNPLFVLIGLVAREVMLWTGVAIGARGTRVRKRNRAAQESYRAELAER